MVMGVVGVMFPIAMLIRNLFASGPAIRSSCKVGSYCFRKRGSMIIVLCIGSVISQTFDG